MAPVNLNAMSLKELQDKYEELQRKIATQKGNATEAQTKIIQKVRQAIQRKKISQYGPAPAIPTAAFEKNRSIGKKTDIKAAEADILQRENAMMAQKKVERKAKAVANHNKKRTMKGTCPPGEPPAGKACVKGHWRKKSKHG